MGVATLLVAIVLIPLTAMTVRGISDLSARKHTVHHTTQVRESLARIDALIALREALHYEQGAADVRLRAVQFGLTNRQASALFGFSGDGQVISTRIVTDRAMDRLSRVKAPMAATEADAMPFDDATLHRLRAQIDDAVIGAAAADLRYETLDSDAEGTLHALLDEASSMIAQVSGGYPVWAHLEALHAVSDGLGAGDAQASGMNELALESGRAAAPTVAHLGQATSLYEADRDHFHDAGVAGLSDAWQQLETAPAIGAFERAVELAQSQALPAVPLFAGHPNAMAAVLRGGFIRDDRLFALVGRTSTVVHDSASALVTKATADYRNGLLLLIGLAVTSIVVALAAARFITRPMPRLADVAGAVSAGRLDVGTQSPGARTRPPLLPRRSMTLSRTFGCSSQRARRWPAATSPTPSSASCCPVIWDVRWRARFRSCQARSRSATSSSTALRTRRRTMR